MDPRAPRPCRLWFALLTLALLTCSCHSIEYDLSKVPIPISAKPETAQETMRFKIEKKAVLWAHGMFGQTDPEIVRLITEKSKGFRRIAGFKVTIAGGFHDWLITHLTATIVRMKSVTIEGVLIK